MATKTISQLPDGKSTILSTALIAFEQDGVTSNASVRPNPENQINVINQAQLEAELGTNLEIPDGVGITVVYDKSFTQTKPFKIGLGSFLEVLTSTVQIIITYTGSGAMFQNTNPANPITALLPHNLVLIGNGTNSVFDIVGTSSVDADLMTMVGFGSVGTIQTAFVLLDSCVFQDIPQGLVVIDASDVTIDKFQLVQTAGETDITYFSFISKTIPITADINTLRSKSPFTRDTLVFCDPNSVVGSKYTIGNSDQASGDFFQLGSDIEITGVADNGSGKARFTTAAAHGLVVGRPVVIKNFVTQTTYNGTFIVTAVDTPLTGITFDVEEITFVADDSTGDMNTASLDQTDPIVIGKGNEDQIDSMSRAQVGFTNIAIPIVVTIATQDVPVIIGGTQYISNGLERASADNTGRITNNTIKTKEYPITLSALIEKVGGGSTNIGLLLVKNGILDLTNTFEIPHSTNAGVVQISGTRDFELAEGDTLDLAVVNFDGTADISVSQGNITYSVET